MAEAPVEQLRKLNMLSEFPHMIRNHRDRPSSSDASISSAPFFLFDFDPELIRTVLESEHVPNVGPQTIIDRIYEAYDPPIQLSLNLATARSQMNSWLDELSLEPFADISMVFLTGLTQLPHQVSSPYNPRAARETIIAQNPRGGPVRLRDILFASRLFAIGIDECYTLSFTPMAIPQLSYKGFLCLEVA